MGSNITCDVDMFAISVDKILNGVASAMDERVGEAVAQSTRRGAKTVRAKAGEGGVHAWSKRYTGGFSARVTKGQMTTGEIGNRREPGLVHLLEKGHATINGRRTRAFPHMEPAYEEIEKDLIERLNRAIGQALEG